MARQNIATIAVMVASAFLMATDNYFLAYSSMIVAGIYRLVIVERKEVVEQLFFTTILIFLAVGTSIAYFMWLDGGYRGDATAMSPYVPAVLWLLVAFFATTGESY